MAIQFARIEIVSRGKGGNACCKGAYNARSKVLDERSGVVYNFQHKGDNVYHEILLPDHVDQKFKNVSVLMNEVERVEKRKDSQLLKEALIALPDDEELNLEDRIEITKRIIERMGWVKDGLAVQIDIHQPHDGKKNWHAHVLILMRRFAEDGKSLFSLKARDLNPEFKNSSDGKGFIIPEETRLQDHSKDVMNEYFKEKGLSNRVDLTHVIPQEHVGPVRMRSIFNRVAERNDEKMDANIKNMKSGKKLLSYVTTHMSVFNEADLRRAVKFVPKADVRERLVGEALANKSLLELFDKNGVKTGYYTTTGIRAEEEKLLRLADYVGACKNVITNGGVKQLENANKLIEGANNILSLEQHKALSHLLLGAKDGEVGIRIVRGRAGTGKSHVLGQVAAISKECGVNVIGLAPTHKARTELASKPGFEQNDTIKGMLFKLKNGRFDLPKSSLLVVDEAGMIGNDDYQELLRVAATRKCNVILSGDERQLASVQRGGMFEVFAEKYGSATILDIKRQDSDWGRSVAMAFSRGEVGTGVSLLQAEDRIKNARSANESMQSLLLDWSRSAEKLSDRLIIAVKNKDVDALNHGARQYLKLEGALKGEEFSVGSHHYMAGDRILIKQTDKKLGLTNGDLGLLIKVAKDKFVIRLDSLDKEGKAQEIEFNPSKYSGFRHGYATTVFKSQGASIFDVFVFHNGFAGIRNSYVALSRNIKNLNLYINEESTKSIVHLIKQLGHDPEVGSSLSYMTKEDLAKQSLNEEYEKGKGKLGSLIEKAFDFTAKKILTLADKYLPKSEYYDYKEPQVKREKVEEVLDIVAIQGEEAAMQVQEKRAVGESFIPLSNLAANTNQNTKATSADVTIANNSNYTNKQKQSAKNRFYANVDHTKKLESHNDQKAIWDNERERLRHEVKFKTEEIARDLLGEPNKKLSNGKTLRFGEHGKIAVRIGGSNMGTWYDFSSSSGGDIFKLVQEKQACDFKQAADYLRSKCGLQNEGRSPSLRLVHDYRNSSLTEEYIKAKEAEERVSKAKEAMVLKLYERSKPVDSTSVAHRYLTEKRGISCSVGEDVRTANIAQPLAENETKPRYLPAIVAFARDANGKVTGGQHILLDKKTGGKADVDIAKKSFGKISGSFVEVGKSENRGVNKYDVTIIAEGLETALSVKQALDMDETNKDKKIKVLCSLGISNIKNYQPTKGEKMIIAADNDGQNAVTDKTIQKAKEELLSKGAFVEIVRPQKEGDFNDLLKQDNKQSSKTGGEKEIQELFRPLLANYCAKNIEEYFKIHKSHKLDEQEKADLAYIQKHNLSEGMESKLIDSYRKDNITGKTELHTTRNNLEFEQILGEKNETKRFEELLPILVKEQEFAKRLEEKNTDLQINRKSEPRLELKDYKLNADPKVLESLKNERDFLIKNKVVIEDKLFANIKGSKDIAETTNNMFKECRSFARYKTSTDIKNIENFDGRGKQEESIQLLKNSKTKHQEYAPYLADTYEGSNLEHLGNRLKLYEIAQSYSQKNSQKHPEKTQEAEEFKQEMEGLYRFSKTNLELAVKTYQEKGLPEATKFASKINSDWVLNRLESQLNILALPKALKGKEYIESIAKDEQIMRYVDNAIKTRKRFKSDVPNNNLGDYANQRDINQIQERLEKSTITKAECNSFKEAAKNFQSYTKTQDLQEGLAKYKTHGIKAFTMMAESSAATRVPTKIEEDLQKIMRRDKVEGFDGVEYKTKSEYLSSIIKDEKLMAYIPPKSQVGQAIAKEEQRQKEQESSQTQKNRDNGFDGER